MRISKLLFVLVVTAFSVVTGSVQAATRSDWDQCKDLNNSANAD